MVFCSHKRIMLSILMFSAAILLVSVAVLLSDVYLRTNYSMVVFNDLKNTYLHNGCKSKEYRTNVTRTVAGLCTIYNSQRIHYMLDFGTLLGAMRNGSVIPWDHDCDFSFIHYNPSAGTASQENELINKYKKMKDNKINKIIIKILNNLKMERNRRSKEENNKLEKQIIDNKEKASINREQVVEEVQLQHVLRRSLKQRSQRCDHFHRTFTQSDIDNDELCEYDFKSDGDAFNAAANLLNRRVPCKYLVDTFELSQVFPDSDWKHCQVSKQFNEILTHYYGSHWNSSWQQMYRNCER
eukprot:528253_1